MRDSENTFNAFTGKVCVVTGAGSGIGPALALNLAVHGAISDINSDAVAETARLAAQVGADVKDLSYEDFDWIMGINSWGVVRAAAIILTGAAKGRSKILVARDAYMIDWLQRSTGAGYQQVVYHFTRLAQKFAKRG